MGKSGMTKYVNDHKDPTYAQALGNIRREHRERLSKTRKQVEDIVRMAGYELEALVVRDQKTGAISKIG